MSESISIFDYCREIIIILVFICGEAYYFLKTNNVIKKYKCIFPIRSERFSIIKTDEEPGFSKISCTHKSEVLQKILLSLNKYLEKNSNSISDYHLMKDVIDRNRDVVESEISTSIPNPQYVGLIGTMIGIIIGVCKLVFGGGLEYLFSNDINALSNSGVPELLGGVGIAVISSIFGLIFTMWNSNSFKDAKKDVETNENLFLSWIQAELLPTLSTDMTSALVKMTNNLNNFNRTFKNNTDELNKTLGNVSETTIKQAEILDLIKRLDISGITTVNLAVYDKLKNCTEEIGSLAIQLQHSKNYLEKVIELTSKLDNADERAKTWEKMGRFFEAEITQFEKRKAAIIEAVADVDKSAKKSIEDVGAISTTMTDSVLEQIIAQNGKLNEALAEQVRLFKEKFDEIGKTIEARNEKMSQLYAEQENAAKANNDALNQYSKEILKLTDFKNTMDNLIKSIDAMSKRVSQQTAQPIYVQHGNEEPQVVVPHIELPLYIKICLIIITIFSIVFGIKAIWPFVVDIISTLQ